MSAASVAKRRDPTIDVTVLEESREDWPMRDGQGEVLLAKRRWIPRLVLRAGALGWSDVGSWDEVYRLSEKDLENNVLIGSHVIARNSRG